MNCVQFLLGNCFNQVKKLIGNGEYETEMLYYYLLDILSFTNMLLILMTVFFIRNNNADTDLKQYPYIVGIGVYIGDETETMQLNTCTGSLVHENWVVTAGDCIAEEKNYYVAFVCYDSGAPIVTKSNITKRHLHPGYQRPTFSTNIGLIEIAKLSEPRLPNLSMDDYSKQFGMPVVYVGFWTNTSGSKPDGLEVGDFVISSCSSVTSTILVCAENKSNKAFNWFTIGAALIKDGTLIGLYIGTGNTHIGRFVPIRYSFNWIDQVINANSPKPAA